MSPAAPAPHVRHLTPADAPALAPLCRQLAGQATPEQVVARLARVAALGPSHALYGAERDGRLVGFVHVFERHVLENEPFAEAGALVVDEAARGTGAGRALMEAAEAWAASRGLATLRLRSNVVREPAHRFYERLGYRVTKSQHVFVKRLAPPV